MTPADRDLLNSALIVQFLDFGADAHPDQPNTNRSAAVHSSDDQSASNTAPPPDHPHLTGAALVKEVCRRIRVARSYWNAHNNRACRHERDRALALYHTLTPAQKAQIPQALRVWLRYRSEKYFGAHRTKPGS